MQQQLGSVKWVTVRESGCIHSRLLGYLVHERFEAAEAIRARTRPVVFPPAREMARIKPKQPGRDDLCACGSLRKWKQCCGALVAD